MPTYKGIELLNDDDLGQFRIWSKMVRAYMGAQHPMTLRSLDGLPPAPPPVAADADGAAVAAAAVANAARAELAAEHAQTAVAHLLLFLDDDMRDRYADHTSGREVLLDIEQEYLDWQLTQAPLLRAKMREMAPAVGETVSQYCRRCEKLYSQLARVGATQDMGTFIDVMMNGLIASRPEWEATVMGVRATRVGDDTLVQLRTRLAEQETSSSVLRGTTPSAALARVPPAADVVAMVAELRTEIARLAARPAPAPAPAPAPGAGRGPRTRTVPSSAWRPPSA